MPGNVLSQAAHDLIKHWKGKRIGYEEAGVWFKETKQHLQRCCQQSKSRRTIHACQHTNSSSITTKQQQEMQPEPRVQSPRVESQVQQGVAPSTDAPQLIVESGQQMPKRLQRELHALDCTVDHEDALPAHRTWPKTHSATSFSNIPEFCIALTLRK